MRVCIYGGSFNPVHNGHLTVARAAVRQNVADEVWMMLSPQNPLKTDHRMLSDDVRLALLTTALKKERRITVSDFECSLPRPSYTINTLEALSRAYPDNVFSLLIGADNWKAFPQWYRHDDILRSYPIIIYPRKGFPIDAASLPSTVTLLKTRLRNISSSDIRERLADGKDIKGMVPEAIIDTLKAVF